jgi:hypothetical protein
LKNKNLNGSVADWVVRVNRARVLTESYWLLRSIVNDSQCDESWPKDPPKIDDPTPIYQVNWGLKLDGNGSMSYHLDVIEATKRHHVDLEDLPLEVLERYTQLRRALEDYLHRGGDYPNPNHMAGGIQLE